MFWIILIAVVGVGVILGVKQAQRNKELYESGKMTKRSKLIFSLALNQNQIYCVYILSGNLNDNGFNSYKIIELLRR